MSLDLTLEFSGGAELLVDKQKCHKVKIQTAGKAWKIQVYCIFKICELFGREFNILKKGLR